MDKPRDIRSSNDWVDTGETAETTDDWMQGIPSEGIEREAILEAVPAIIPTTLGRTAVPGSKGIKGVLTKQHSEREVMLNRKKALEPCWMCVHFNADEFTLLEKELLLKRLLVEEHGWPSEKIVEAELGSPEKYGYCRIFELLTHRDATCLRYFVRRKNL